MVTLTDEQNEAKKQQLKLLAEQAQVIYNELVEAGAIELSDEELDQASGGSWWNPFTW